MGALETFLREVQVVRLSGEGVSELSYYPALLNLLEEAGGGLKPKVRCVMNLKNRGAGLPDGGLFTADQVRRPKSARNSGTVPEADAMQLTRPPKTGPPIGYGVGPEKEERIMPSKRYRPEEIIAKLREAEVLIGQGRKVPEMVKAIGISEVSYYRWRKEYGGMDVSQAKRLKELEQENSRLRRAVSDLTLDKLILQEAVRGNY
jgi:hypothetical protein